MACSFYFNFSFESIFWCNGKCRGRKIKNGGGGVFCLAVNSLFLKYVLGPRCSPGGGGVTHYLTILYCASHITRYCTILYHRVGCCTDFGCCLEFFFISRWVQHLQRWSTFTDDFCQSVRAHGASAFYSSVFFGVRRKKNAKMRVERKDYTIKS